MLVAALYDAVEKLDDIARHLGVMSSALPVA
jgi:hypothetical protein